MLLTGPIVYLIQQHTGSSVDTEAKVEGSGTKLSAAEGGDVPECPENIEKTGDNQESEDRVEPSPKM